MPCLLGHTPQNPSHHPARSNRHHLQQPQPRSHWSTYHNTRQNKAYMQPDPQQKSYRQDMNTTPKIIGALLLVVCWLLLPPSHLIPTEKLPLSLFSRRDAVCLCCIHLVLQNIQKQTKDGGFLPILLNCQRHNEEADHCY